MQKITYKQAAELLGVQYETIKNAVFYNRLTKCATSSGETMLLREQVELFKNKKISTKKLNLEEKALWDEYKKIAENTDLLHLATENKTQNEPAYVLIAREITKLGQNERKEKIDQALEQIRRQLEIIDNLHRGEPAFPLMPLALR